MQGSNESPGVKNLDFMGADIAVEARCQPQWRNRLGRARKRQAAQGWKSKERLLSGRALYFNYQVR